MHTQYCVESRGFVKTNVRRAILEDAHTILCRITWVCED